MKKLKESSALKKLCYILAPVLFLVLVLSCIGEYLKTTYDREQKDYYQTSYFASHYYSRIQYIYNSMLENEEIYFNTIIQDENPTIYYQEKTNLNEFFDGFEFIVVDETNYKVYTNVQLEDYQQEIQNMKQQTYHWYCEENVIQTDIEKMNEGNIRYEYGNKVIQDWKEANVKVYMNFDETNIENENTIYLEKRIYHAVLALEMVPTYTIPLSSILLILIVIYLIWSIGHRKGEKGIYLNSLDKLSYEWVLIVAFILFFIAFCFGSALCLASPSLLYLWLGLIVYFVAYATFATLVDTTIKRLKAKALFRNLWICRICRWIKKELQQVIFSNLSLVGKTTFFYGAFLGISVLIVLTADSMWGILVLLAFWGVVFYTMLRYVKQFQILKEAIQSIYEGKENVNIDTKKLGKEFKKMAIHINDIAKGFEVAIEENLKSERMKTELITNVSHDIKTPLTSIINYVDLLKREEMPNEKAKEYLEVLDNKSQRLKRLTEDLVEASKASSGNIKLQIEKLDVKEMIKQIAGEFEDKFKEKNLEMNISIPKEDCFIQADSRYLYRVLENLYSNVQKYALENSRVYIDVIKTKREVQIKIKNISKEKLNISADELMQRFVRGDSSRNTEGSGLGLSIAQSLIELQNGTFEIYLDGDLFKVSICFQIEN